MSVIVSQTCTATRESKVNSWDTGSAAGACVLYKWFWHKFNSWFCPPIWFAEHSGIFADRHCVFQHLRPKKVSCPCAKGKLSACLGRNTICCSGEEFLSTFTCPVLSSLTFHALTAPFSSYYEIFFGGGVIYLGVIVYKSEIIVPESWMTWKLLV